MALRQAVQTVDHYLHDIRQNNRPLGDMTVVFYGDFRQTLLFIPRETRVRKIKARL